MENQRNGHPKFYSELAEKIRDTVKEKRKNLREINRASVPSIRLFSLSSKSFRRISHS